MTSPLNQLTLNQKKTWPSSGLFKSPLVVLPCLLAVVVNLSVNLSAISTHQATLTVHKTNAAANAANANSRQEAQNIALLDEVVAYMDTPEYKTRAIAREKRLRDIELELAAAKQADEKKARFTNSFNNSVVLETPPQTPLFAFGGKNAQTKVTCESTEFGFKLTLSTSATPEVFYVAKYVTGCKPGIVSSGTQIGQTVDILGWSEHSQVTGVALAEPNRAPMEAVLVQYDGKEHQAPVNEINLADTADRIKQLWQDKNP